MLKQDMYLTRRISLSIISKVSPGMTLLKDEKSDEFYNWILLVSTSINHIKFDYSKIRILVIFVRGSEEIREMFHKTFT